MLRVTSSVTIELRVCGFVRSGDPDREQRVVERGGAVGLSGEQVSAGLVRARASVNCTAGVASAWSIREPPWPLPE